MLYNKKDKGNKSTARTNSGGGFERLKRKNSARLLRRRVFYIVLLVLLLVIFVAGSIALFFRVEGITVEGNTTRNTDGEIIEASGIKQDMNIYLIDDNSVKSSLLSAFPYVKTVKLERNIPSNITLALVCDLPGYYTEISGEYFVLSNELRIIERFTALEELKQVHPNIKKLVGGEVATAIVGNEMTFVNDAYTEVGRELLSVLESTEVWEGVSSIDFSDRFNIYVVYDGRLKANVGNTDELQLKLRFMNEIVKDLGEAKGTIDIKDVEAAYVLLDSNASYD